MADKPYSIARVSTDGRWHVVAETPSCIATPDGGIAISWGGTDLSRIDRAEQVAAEIVDAMNRRALPAVTPAVKVKTLAVPSAPVEVCPECDIAGCHHIRKRQAEPAVTPAPTLAAALALPEIKALVEAVKAIDDSYIADCGCEECLRVTRGLADALRRIAEGGE